MEEEAAEVEADDEEAIHRPGVRKVVRQLQVLRIGEEVGRVQVLHWRVAQGVRKRQAALEWQDAEVMVVAHDRGHVTDRRAHRLQTVVYQFPDTAASVLGPRQAFLCLREQDLARRRVDDAARRIVAVLVQTNDQLCAKI